MPTSPDVPVVPHASASICEKSPFEGQGPACRPRIRGIYFPRGQHGCTSKAARFVLRSSPTTAVDVLRELFFSLARETRDLKERNGAWDGRYWEAKRRGDEGMPAPETRVDMKIAPTNRTPFLTQRALGRTHPHLIELVQ